MDLGQYTCQHKPVQILKVDEENEIPTSGLGDSRANLTFLFLNGKCFPELSIVFMFSPAMSFCRNSYIILWQFFVPALTSLLKNKKLSKQGEAPH